MGRIFWISNGRKANVLQLNICRPLLRLRLFLGNAGDELVVEVLVALKDFLGLLCALCVVTTLLFKLRKTSHERFWVANQADGIITSTQTHHRRDHVCTAERYAIVALLCGLAEDALDGEGRPLLGVF